MITSKFVVSRGVFRCGALADLLRVHISQLCGIDYRSPRVKGRELIRCAEQNPGEVAVRFTFTVWYPKTGDVRRTATYIFQADPVDGLFYGLDQIYIG